MANQGRMSKGMEGAGRIVYIVTGILAVLAYLMCAIFLFPLGLVLGFIPLFIILAMGTFAGTILRPSTYKGARGR